MKQSTIATLAPLLTVLRGYSALEAVGPTRFLLNGRDFIHFHDDAPEGLVADVRLAKGRVRLAVATPAEQAELIERIEQKLVNLEPHANRMRARTRRQNS